MLNYKLHLEERVLFFIAAFGVPLEGLVSNAYSIDSPENFYYRFVISIIGLIGLFLSFKLPSKNELIERTAQLVIYGFIILTSYLNYVYKFSFDTALLLITAFIICSIYFKKNLQLIIYIAISTAIVSFVAYITENSILPTNAFIGRFFIASIITYGLSRNVQVSKKKNVIAKLVAQNSAKMKQEFLANMSHEIRTPINAILGFSDLLSETKLNDLQNDYLKIVKNSSNALLLLVNDILDYSKLEAGKLNIEKIKFKIKDKIDELIAINSVSAQTKNIKITRSFNSNFPDYIIGDQLRLSQILINLISNSIKFAPHDGKIEIECICTNSESDNCTIEFKVKDNGIGIPEEKLKTIFESYEQAESSTSRNYGGTGLGLSIVQKLISLQNGTIEIESTVGVGTTISFTIPYKKYTPKPEDILKEKQKVVVNQSLKGMKILIVEDNEINLKLAKIRLLKWECDLLTAESGEACIEILETNPELNLILMDIQMPGMNGYEATKIIREKLSPQISKLPILALTANSYEGYEKECKEKGLNGYIGKPFKPNELFSKIAKYKN